MIRAEVETQSIRKQCALCMGMIHFKANNSPALLDFCSICNQYTKVKTSLRDVHIDSLYSNERYPAHKEKNHTKAGMMTLLAIAPLMVPGIFTKEGLGRSKRYTTMLAALLSAEIFVLLYMILIAQAII
jgi:hypothetical protein